MRAILPDGARCRPVPERGGLAVALARRRDRDVHARSRPGGPPHSAAAAGRAHRGHRRLRGPLRASWRCCRTSSRRLVSLGAPRRGPGRLGPRRRFDRAGPGPVRATPRRGGATWWRSAVVRDEVGVPGTGPVAFGSFAFADDSAAGATLVVPEVVVGRRDGSVVADHDRRRPRAARPTPDLRSRSRRATPDGRHASPTARSPRADWAGRGRRGGRADHRRRARQGRAGPRPARAAPGSRSTPAGCCGGSPSATTRPGSFAVDGLVGATPELLVRREQGLVTSRVLAGTIRRTGDDAHDLALAASLARSSQGPRGARVRRALGRRRARARTARR